MTQATELIAKQMAAGANLGKIWSGIMYNVLDNGLKGDGVTNDTAALQSLITSAIAAGRRTIFFPHTPTGGKYYVTALINAGQVDFVGDNASFVGGYTGTITNFGGISTFLANNELSNTIKKMAGGLTTQIVAYGDSLTLGFKIGSADPQTQVANPYPLDLQTKLRSAYANNSIVVTNSGVGGWDSFNAVQNLKTKVLDLNPDLCILMFGINDTFHSNTLDDYKKNMIYIVQTLIRQNIEVLLMTPSSTTGNFNLVRYAEAAAEIAEQYGIALIDMHTEINKLFDTKTESLIGLQPDGTHFADAKYSLFADIILGKMLNYKMIQIDRPISIPMARSSFVDSNVTSYYSNNGHFYRVNYSMNRNGTTGTYIRFYFFVERPGLDLYLNSEKNTFGGKINVTDNGTVIKSVNFYDSENSVFESNDLLLQNVPVGHHVIELNVINMTAGQATDAIGLAMPISFEFKNGTTKTDNLYNLTGAVGRGKITKFTRIINGTVRYVSTAAGVDQHGALLLDGPTAEIKANKLLVIEAEGKLASASGISWFGSIAENDAGNHPAKVNPGYLLYWENNQVTLISVNANATTTNLLVATPTIDYAVIHKVKITNDNAGAIIVLLDGTQIISVTNSNHNTGYFGVYSARAGTLELSRFEFAYE